ncbi:hypothetical protein H1R17_11595 [Flavobacterium sp. xlx-214]|uniref:hypothetical protein n=1 Tax=unclassified Flavobacterium TaxID=196869 RepID=UPI0013D45E10|nr:MULTISPECIES: hypothetical protein [unclassified Flavobacterium]MBA5791860.1 hypothetical protein [Flavobacterium sp. xlx-221]QMI83097.1 hypothetical protein H1R17_11595 [Flavobacterium sp. xlx-214]
MITQIPVIYVVALLFAMYLIAYFLKFRSKNVDAFEKMKLSLILFGIYSIVLWLCVPSTPTLATFGYPETVNDIKADEQVLKLLQDYNKTIVRTTEVLKWFLFGFIWFFMTNIYLYATHRENEFNPKNKQ